MRKSPFSTPRGNGGQHGFKWKSNERRGGRGYVHHMNNSFDSNYSPNISQNTTGSDDFIAFDTSSPSSYDNTQSGSFFSARGGRNRNYSASPGIRHENYSPRAYFDNSFSPYRNDWRQSRGRSNKMLQQRLPRREIHISQYVDLVSILEDPWKDLMKEQNKSTMSKETSNDISMESTTCELDLDDSFDDGKLLNTSSRNQDIDNRKMNNDIKISSTDKLDSNDKSSKNLDDNQVG